VLSPEDVALIEESAAVLGLSLDETFASRGPNQLAERFYALLFDEVPELQALFPSDTAAQGRKLCRTLALLARGASRLDQLLPGIQELGRRHLDYGAKPEHYPVVAETLLRTFAAVGGDAWTHCHREAWAKLITFSSEVMIAVGAASPWPRPAG
jgi:nitric oxide dioxygenase